MSDVYEIYEYIPGPPSSLWVPPSMRSLWIPHPEAKLTGRVKKQGCDVTHVEVEADWTTVKWESVKQSWWNPIRTERSTVTTERKARFVGVGSIRVATDDMDAATAAVKCQREADGE